MYKIILIFSVILLPYNGGIAFYSPSNLIQSCGLLIHRRVKFTNVYLLLTLILAFLIVQIFRFDLFELLKVFIVLGGVLLAFHIYNGQNTRILLSYSMIYFTLDFILRVIRGSYDVLSIYSIKYSSGISIDPNFCGIMIVSVIAGRLSNNAKLLSPIHFYMLFLLITTMSRTAWLLFALVLISSRSIFLGITLKIAVVFIFSYLFFVAEVPSGIESSLTTKIYIAQVFQSWLSEGKSLLIGLGDYNAGILSEDLGYKGFISHTLLGLATVNGLIMSGAYVGLSYYAFSKLKDKCHFSTNLLVVGFIGLWPISMIGSLAILHAIGSKSVRK